MQTPQGTERMAAPRHAQAKRLKKLHLLPAHNGGFIVSHHFHPEHGGTPAPEKHVFKTYPEAHAHLEQTMKAHHHG